MLQSYNRYAYVMNNPLNLTDPSGYWSLGGFLRNMDTFTRHPSSINAFNAHRSVPGVVSLDNFVVKHPWAFQLGRAAAGAWGGPWAAAGATGYYTYLTTGCESCSVKAFGRSIAISYAFTRAGDVGEGADSAGNSNQYGVGHYASHAAVGCVSSAASGGQCGAGALSAVAGLAGTQIGGAIGAGTAGRFATSVVAGGIASRLAGGSFMDGAQTAAYGYLFNELQHYKGSSKERLRLAGYEQSPDYVAGLAFEDLRTSFPGEYANQYRLAPLAMGENVTGFASPLLRNPLNIIFVNSDMFSSISANNLDDYVFMLTHEAGHLKSNITSHIRDGWAPNNPAHEALDNRAYERSRGTVQRLKSYLGF
jgi:hypothetical protein